MEINLLIVQVYTFLESGYPRAWAFNGDFVNKKREKLKSVTF